MTKAPNLQRTVLGVERKLAEMHLTSGRDGQPLGEGDPAVRVDPDEAVGDRDLVEVGVLAVEEEGVRAPDLVEELPVHGQLARHPAPVVHQPLVIPGPATGSIKERYTIHSCFYQFCRK